MSEIIIIGQNGRDRQFKGWMLDRVMEVGQGGGSFTEMALACGLPARRLREWVNENSQAYIPEMADAVEMALDYSKVFWEKIGKAAASGLLRHHSAPTYNKMTSWLFDSAKETGQEKDVAGNIIEVNPSLDPAEAERQYKELLSNYESASSIKVNLADSRDT